MKELKKQLEAILFSVARYISTHELAQLVKTDSKHVRDALLSLLTDIQNNPETSLVLLNEADQWKLTIKHEFAHLVKTVVTDSDLPKTVLETLAVIAFKYPIKQSDLIRIRTNKAYDHLMELEKQGFIIRQRYGRSRLIKLTDKFFDYFDLPKDKLRDRFKGFEALAKTIEVKEETMEKVREDQQRIAEEAKSDQERERKVIDGEVDVFDTKGVPQPLQTYKEEIKVDPAPRLEIPEEIERLEPQPSEDAPVSLESDLPPLDPLPEFNDEIVPPAETQEVKPESKEPVQDEVARPPIEDSPPKRSVDDVLGFTRKKGKKIENSARKV